MKTNILLALLILSSLVFLWACGQSSSVKNQHELPEDSNIDTAPQQRCFLRVDGTAQQDSTFVQIQFKGDSIEGIYNWIPYEKDGRKGTLKGKRVEDTLDVVWSYVQEGISDTLHTVFILEKDILKQQPFMINQENGREALDKNATFDIEYNEVPCRDIK